MPSSLLDTFQRNVVEFSFKALLKSRFPATLCPYLSRPILLHVVLGISFPRYSLKRIYGEDIIVVEREATVHVKLSQRHASSKVKLNREIMVVETFDGDEFKYRLFSNICFARIIRGMKFHLLLVFKYPCQAKCSSRRNCVSPFVRTRLDRLMDEW